MKGKGKFRDQTLKEYLDKPAPPKQKDVGGSENYWTEREQLEDLLNPKPTKKQRRK